MTPQTVVEYLLRLIELCRKSRIDFEACLSSTQAEDYRQQGAKNV